MTDNGAAQEAFDGFVQMWVTGTTAGRRAPLLRRPDEVGLDYEDVTFPSMDGVPLEGWFIPADSDTQIMPLDAVRTPTGRRRCRRQRWLSRSWR